MWRKPARRCGPHVFREPTYAVARTNNSRCRGWTLAEMMVVVAIIGVLVKISLPSIQNTILTYRLSAAAASAASAVQQTRFQAIQIGCPYTVAFATGSTTYQVQWEKISNATPPVCATTFTNVGPAIPWTTSGGIRVTSSPTFQFSPGGIVTATVGGANCAMPCSFTLTNGSPSTRTIVVSGVGNVKVTTP